MSFIKSDVSLQNEGSSLLKKMKILESTWKPPFADLGKMLQIIERSVHNRYNEILKHEDKTANYKQKYKREESVKIMKAEFDVNKNVLVDNDIGTTAEVWNELGNFYKHWHRYIHPTLTLIKYMVDNKIMCAQEANWGEIVSNPLFHGTTPTYLSKIYGQVAGDAKKKYPNISNSEMTSVIMQKYLQERKIQKPMNRKDVDDLISSYESLN